ncbi:MAG: hypothetical protein RLZ14_413 [Actinomycetota bacterium]|jgi:hypothetical protein
MIAVMSVSEQTPYVVISYVVTLGGIAGYAWYLLRRARRSATQVPPEERPWT